MVVEFEVFHRLTFKKKWYSFPNSCDIRNIETLKMVEKSLNSPKCKIYEWKISRVESITKRVDYKVSFLA